MNFKKYQNLIVQFLIFFTLIQLISTDEAIIDLELNKTITGSMFKKDSHEYYKLKIPNNIKQGSLLVFTVKESRKGIEEGDDIFSDPDIYVSKKNLYPKSKDQAEWYSQRYGNDILTIPAEEIKSGEVFYIGMFCEFKCRYELNSYLANEVEIGIGKIHSIVLTKKGSANFYVNIPKEDFEEFNLVATSPNLKNFKVYMSNLSPSSQNTFPIIPSWTGGYMISVERYSNYYCTDCKYNILVQSEEEKDVTVQFYAYFQDTITKVTSGNIIYDAVKRDKKRCYSFDTKGLNMYREKILIQATLFSGSALLYVSGEKEDTQKNLKDVLDDNYSYQIQGEKIVMLDKTDLDKLNEGFIPNKSSNKGLLHFCIYGKEMTSFVLNVYSLSDASKLQKYNYISPGTELIGYLKGDQVTRYRVLDFNKNRNSNITITFTSLKGKTDFYVNFCSQNCNLNKESLQEKIRTGEMLVPQEISYSTQSLVITSSQNKCYQNIEDEKCKILLVMKCSEDESLICSYKMLVSISDQPILMSPKKTYYNIIPKGKTDYYEIIVDDITLPSIVVVLTTLTGDAQLAIFRKNNISEFGIDEKNAHSFAFSRNKDYIPDVVRITPSNVGKDNISGRYLVKVYSECFTSYNLYYYTTRNKAVEREISINDITASLTEGKIIRDFFPNDIDYKIYIYTPGNDEEKDIKFVLTRINVGFSFKIFNDFKKIKILNYVKHDFEEKLQGYIWASDENNEVTISKTDKNYSNKKSYYIVVYKSKNTIKDEEENKNLNRRSMMMYYLGVTKIGTPFTLYEVVEHSETLSTKYFYQNYWYIHNDISENFNLDVNILNGEVDVFVNTNQIPIENITNKNIDLSLLQDSIVSRINIKDYTSIELNSNYFRQFCKNSKMNYNEELTGEQKSCQLYIYIVQSKSSIKYQKDSQYIITARSSAKTGKILLSGQVLKGEIPPNSTEHFYIEEVKHRKGCTINVKFTEGFGEIYVRIPNKIETGKKIFYPDEKHYDYKGQNAYMGQIVNIPSKVFDRINSLSLKLQILITLVAQGQYRQNPPKVKYTISYSSEPKRINQNTPYTNFISTGEYQYYTLYFNKNAKNIYIALSNMNGDADLYLNYGIDELPSPTNHDWYSVNMGHEYIDINENDKFFVEKKINDISGYYSLLVVGFTETTYTLFVSSHEDKVFPLNDNSPISCRCESKGDKCFFRYDNIFKTRGDEPKLYKDNEIIFTTQYIYGNGKMYANLYKDQELTYETRKKYQEFFPDEKIYQYSNAEFGKRNYMKVKVTEDKYSKDSLILMTFICEEKTDVEITASSLSYSNIYNYIEKDRENIYYLKFNNSLSSEKQIPSTFTFYSFKDEDIIYEFKAYVGMAIIKVFTNESFYNTTTGDITYDYNHISEFTLRSDKNYLYKINKVFTENYINSIQKSIVAGKRIYFTVKPLTDFGFYLQILYDREWVNIPINKDKTYLITNNQMYGYFDIYKDFQNIEMTVSMNAFNYKIAKLYIKLIVIEKDSKHIYSGNREDRLYHYEIPGKYNYDYFKKTNNYLGTINININNVPIIKPEDLEKKIVRALFCIEIEKIFHYINPRNPTNNDVNYEKFNKKETDVRILVTPGVNNFKRVDILPYNYYFSQTPLVPQQTIKDSYENNFNYNGYKEIKIYSLDRINEKDDKMIIQINSCSGSYETKLSKKIVTYDDNSNDVNYDIIDELQGRKTLIVNNLRDKHLYLSIKSAQNEHECSYGNPKDRNNTLCSKELSYLLYYYSTSSNRQYTKNNIYKIHYRLERTKFYLIVPQINNVNKEFLQYDLVWTTNETFSKKLESVCYLSQILNKEIEIDNTTVFIQKDIKLNNRNQAYIREIHLSKQPTYINLLVRNSKNNELIAFQPIVAKLDFSLFSAFVLFFIIIGILILWNYYYSTIKNKCIDLYINGFSFSELFRKKKETVAYSNLSDNYY